MEWMLMPLKRYADFSGRSRRMEFWMWQVAKFLLGIVLWIVMLAVFGAAFAGVASNKDPASFAALGGGIIVVMLLGLIVGLGIFIPDLAVSVRRLHDTNRSGWWVAAPLGSYFLTFILAGGAMATVGGTSDPGAAMAIVGIVTLICMLATLGLCLLLIVFYFLEGTPGPNKYGPDPKGRDTAQTFS
jgi:uncharacterized membrane protein YhaH (DUF805 family)